MYYYLQKTCIHLYMYTCVSKTPDSSSIQLKKYTHLKICSPQILSLHKEIWASSSGSGYVTRKLFLGSVTLRLW